MRNYWGIVIMVLVLSLVFIGCSAPAPSPSPSSASPPASASKPAPTTAPAKVFQLKMAEAGSATATTGKASQAWAKRIEQKTNGQVVITHYFSDTLLKEADLMKGISTGIADLISYSIGSSPGVHQLNEVTKLRFLGLPKAPIAFRIWMEMMDKFPEIQKDLGPVKTLGGYFAQPSHLHTTKKPVRVPDDIRGMKIISRDAALVPILASLNASALPLGAPDWYLSMERGLADGQFIDIASADRFKTIELFKYHTIFGTGGISANLVNYFMNIDVWNSIPSNLQQIILKEAEQLGSEIMTAQEVDETNAWNKCRERGNTFLVLTPEEIQKWRALFLPTHEAWITASEAKGYKSARAMYDEMQKKVNEYK